MNEMARASSNLESFPFYDPNLFEALNFVLKALGAFAETGSTETFYASLVSGNDGSTPALEEVVSKMGFEKALTEAHRQAPVGYALRMRLHTWFDSFKTLRFIHQLRDLCAPSIPWRDALEQAAFIQFDGANVPLSQEALEQLRTHIASLDTNCAPSGLSPTPPG